MDKIHPRPEYILTIDTLSSRVANKYVSDCKVISLNGPLPDSELAYSAFMKNLDKLQEVYESLIDEESKKTFYGYWLGNISHQFGALVHSNNSHYMLEGFIPERGAIVIDGGAFDGGSAVIFSEMGYKVYSFEMDKAIFENLKAFTENKNVVVERMGLGSVKHEMRYTPSGNSGTKLNNIGSEIAQVTTLDAYVRENNLPSVDFIKLDVEGAELDVLKGATTVLSRYKPILAISAYHKWDDLWTLMNFVKSVRSDYEWAFRHYPASYEDAPSVIPKETDIFAQELGLDANDKRYFECVLFAR